jgi:hypothetical protein
MPAIIPLAIAAVGAAATMKGASDQKKAIEGSNALNSANFQQQQKTDWERYTMARGVNPDTGTAINAKLPFWANVKPTTTGGTTGSFAVPSYKA